MNENSLLQLVMLVAWLVLAGSAYASYKLEWRTMVRQGFIWAAIFAGVTLIVSLVTG